MLANPFSERCAFVQGACRSSRIDSKTTGVWHAGRRYQVKTLSKGLDEGCWMRASAGEGSKGERLYAIGPASNWRTG